MSTKNICINFTVALELLTNKENVSNIIGNAKYLGPEELIERLPLL